MRLFLEGFKEGLKYFGENINFLVNSVLFFIVYVFGVGLTSIIMKIFGKNLLELKQDQKKSYWKDFNEKDNLESYYNQF